ncbi:Wzz/FepE/Etk N-terminal domain-containing protein [Vibrio furnissii]|uniref:Wzz/FepE/Etk N-terminal domain-containing protein n=1 Tax=Vibrio furnissii TaxID=29494 RepID=UPI001EEC63AE|nr:Wzz/FepE/Etk N-terminal domain-containing protein [Vibrio furnissii]MCG6267271.1 Wzz/FepE/Etk N-terminal domain-containing protein [Vibrio furnissii]
MQQNQIQYQPYPPSSASDDEIDLRELFSAIWNGKWIIIVVTAIFAIASVIYALKQPNIYKADALLAPAENSGGGLSKMAGQLGGLAALAGVNIGGAEASQADLAVQVMMSRKFLESFIKKHDLLVPLMATKGWNMTKNKLVFDKELYNVKDKKWLREPNGLRGEVPTAQESYERFVKNTLKITQDKESGLYTVSVMHYSPYIAQQWVTWLVDDINKVMRQRAISETTQNLAYLNSQIQKTAVADMQSTFYKLIEEQTKSLMLAEVQDEFVFEVVDPAIVPEVKDQPKRALIVVLGLLLGLIFGIITVLFKSFFK